MSSSARTAGKAFDLTNTVDTRDGGVLPGRPGFRCGPTRAGGKQPRSVGGASGCGSSTSRGRPWVDRGGRDVDEVATHTRFGSPARVYYPDPDTRARRPGPQLTYVALGDSLLFAAEEDCDGCTSAAVIYGQQHRGQTLGTPVEVHNLTMHNGLDQRQACGGTSRRAPRSAEIAEDIFAAVAAADIVSVTIGFNDFGYPSNIPATAVTPFAANLDAILGRIRRSARRQGHRRPGHADLQQRRRRRGRPSSRRMNDVICDRRGRARRRPASTSTTRSTEPDGSGSPAARAISGPIRPIQASAAWRSSPRPWRRRSRPCAAAFDPAAHGRPGNEGGAE